MKQRLAVFTILLALFALLGVMAVMADVSGAPGAAPLYQATNTPTPTATMLPNAICDSGTNAFSGGYLRCYNPEGEIKANDICGYNASGYFDSEGVIGAVLVVPDVSLAITTTEMFIGYLSGSAPSVPYVVKVFRSDDMINSIATSANFSSTVPMIVSTPGSQYAFVPPVEIAFSPPVLLLSGYSYYFIPMEVGTYQSNALFGHQRIGGGAYCNEGPRPGWMPERTQECAINVGTGAWTCFDIADWVSPLALYGYLYVPPVTPTATPTRAPVWISEAHGAAAESTPCVDWNSRSRCGANDDFIEVSIGNPAIATPRAVNGWTLEVGACLYTFGSDNMTGPVKVIYADDMLQVTNTPTVTPTRTPTPTATPA